MIHVAFILGTLAMFDDQRICIQSLTFSRTQCFLAYEANFSTLWTKHPLSSPTVWHGVSIDPITSPNSRHCFFKMTSFRCLEASMAWLSHRCPESQHKNLNLLCDLTGCLGQMISKLSSSGRLTEKDSYLVLVLLGNKIFFFLKTTTSPSAHTKKSKISGVAIHAVLKLKQRGCWEFEVSPGYTTSYSPAWATEWDLASEPKKVEKKFTGHLIGHVVFGM